MMNTNVLLDQQWNAAAGTPDAGMPFLFRATPQHGNRRDGLIARKPTRTAAGHSRDHSAGTLDATKPTAARDTQLNHQGILFGSAWLDVGASE